REVITIERRPELAELASRRLALLERTNVTVLIGDGTLGSIAHAPFDAILVAAGAPRIPETLKAQLAPGGRLVIPVGASEEQTLYMVTRGGDRFEVAPGVGCVFVPLIGVEGWGE